LLLPTQIFVVSAGILLCGHCGLVAVTVLLSHVTPIVYKQAQDPFCEQSVQNSEDKGR
jgi:hypothetical protein